MRHQPQEPEFADLVRNARSTRHEEPTRSEPWPQPIRDRHWTDPSGTQWHMRGRELPRLAARRLLRRPDLRVLHAYGAHPTEVAGPERDVLLARVEEYFAGGAPPHSQFCLAEFRDDQRHVMLVIEEAC